MFDLDKLSYKAFGNLVIIVLLVIAILLNLFPFSLMGMIICVMQIPIYLFVRASFSEPIHAEGLNICFALTNIFYILLFISIKAMMLMIDLPLVIIFSCLLTILGCYATSTLPNKMELKGKLFFGYKKHSDSKYKILVDFIKDNESNSILKEAEERLEKFDNQTYLIYKRKFKEDKTFKEITEEFQIDNPRVVEILDKAYFYMIGALKI